MTHDQVEAMTLADRIAILNRGNLEQYGAPLEVYHHPNTQFVASFIGTPPMNFVSAEVIKNSSVKSRVPAGTKTAGFRPEVTLLSTGSSSLSSAKFVELGKGRVSLVEPLGSTTHVHVKMDASNIVSEMRSQPISGGLATGKLPLFDQEIAIWADPENFFYFDEQGRRL